MTNSAEQKIREILKVTGWSQEQLAREVGVTFAALNRWLNQGVVPREIYLHKIAALYKQRVEVKPISAEMLKKRLRQGDAFKIRNIQKLIEGNESLQEELLLLHTYNSNAIEGSTFTLKQTQTVLFSKAHFADKSLMEHMEIVNHGKVLKDIFNAKYKLPITEELIKVLHRDLLHGIREDAGEYSRHLRRIRGVDLALPHPEDIPEEMRHLIKSFSAQSKINPVERVARFHADFEAIHPFGDGNGRVGRLIMVLQLMAENYPPVLIENNRKADYYDALENAQRNSYNYLVDFLVDEIEKTYAIFKNYQRA